MSTGPVTVAWVLGEDTEGPQPPPPGSKLARLLLTIATQETEGAFAGLVKHAELYAACEVIAALGELTAQSVMRIVGQVAHEPAADPTAHAARLDRALRDVMWA